MNGHAVSQGKTQGTFMPQTQQASQPAIPSRESSTQQVFSFSFPPFSLIEHDSNMLKKL